MNKTCLWASIYATGVALYDFLDFISVDRFYWVLMRQITSEAFNYPPINQTPKNNLQLKNKLTLEMQLINHHNWASFGLPLAIDAENWILSSSSSLLLVSKNLFTKALSEMFKSRCCNFCFWQIRHQCFCREVSCEWTDFTAFQTEQTNEWNDFTRFNILRLWHLDYSFWQSIEPRVAVSMRNLIFLNRRRSLFSWGSRKLVSFENHRIAQHQHLKRALRYLSSDETDSSNKNNSNNFLEILCKARPQFLVFLVKRLLLGKFLWGQKDFPLCDTRKLIFPSSRCDPTTMKIEIASARQHHELG